MTLNFFCISSTSNSLSDCNKNFKKLYRVENFRANVLKSFITKTKIQDHVFLLHQRPHAKFRHFWRTKKFHLKKSLTLSCTNPFNYVLLNLGVLCIADWPTNNVITFNAGDEESEETPKTVRSEDVSYFIYLCFVPTCFIACKVSSWQGHKRSLNVKMYIGHDVFVPSSFP